MIVNYCCILTLGVIGIFTAAINHGKLPRYFITLAPDVLIASIQTIQKNFSLMMNEKKFYNVNPRS
jgi:hypothetical protein